MANINIYGELHNDTPNGFVASSQEIMDTEMGMRQSEINEELMREVSDSNTAYLVCSTPGSTAAKTIDLDNFTLSTNVRLLIKMEHAHTNTQYTPTLNIGGTGMESIQFEGSAASYMNTWADGEVLDVYYDGTQYVAKRTNKNKIGNVGYVECNTAAGTVGKEVNDFITLSGFELGKNVRVLVKMINTNTASNPTLNINGTGAKSIVYNGSAASSSNSWSAGEVLDVYYDGTNYVATTHGGAQFSTGEKVGDVGIDDEPTAGSDNLVKSGGVQNELALGAVYDVSAKNPTAGPNSDGKWESLSALLSDANLNTLIPTSVRKGGMSIKFVQSSDNKYVQFRYMLTTYENTTAGNKAFKNTANWQGVDDEPIAESHNLVESGGVRGAIDRSIIDITGVVDQFYDYISQYAASGAIAYSDTYWKTGLVKVNEGDSFGYALYANSALLVIAAFDSSKNLLLSKSITGAGGQTLVNGTYTVESEVAYLQFVTIKTKASSSSVSKNNPAYQDSTIKFDGKKNVNGGAVFNFGGGPVVSPVSIDDYIGASIKKIPSGVHGSSNCYISVDAAGLYEIDASVEFDTIYGNSSASALNPLRTYHSFVYNGKKYIYVSASDVTAGVVYLIISPYNSSNIISVYYYITCDKINDINVQLSVDRTNINNINKKFIVENEIQPKNDPNTTGRNQWISYFGIKKGEKYYMTQFPSGYSITSIGCATDYGISYLVGDVTEFNYDSESNTYSFKVPYNNITYLRINISAVNPGVLRKDFILTTVQTITNEDLSVCVEKGNPLKGKYVAVIGDSISTGADMNPYIKILDSDVDHNIQSYVTFFDVYSDTSLTPTNKTIGGVTLTSEMIGTLQTFMPVAADVGKEIGVADVYQQYLNKTFGWAYVLCEKAGAKLINASWSGASMCSGQGAQSYAASYAWHDCTIGRCKTRDNDGNTIVPDVIIIYRGTNDFSHVQGGNQYSQLDSDYNLGNNGYPETDIYDTDKYGFYRAYYLTIKKLRVTYPKAVIYCATLNEFKRIIFDRFPTRNGQYTLPDMNNAIREIANNMGCGVIEFDKDGITFENCGVEYPMWPSTDPTHPMSNGHAVMAKKALSDISFAI